MTKKSILFAANYMNMGGVEKSLLALINALPEKDFDIHLALMNTGGKLFDKIPPRVTVHYIEPYKEAMAFLDHPVKETLARLKGSNKGKAVRDFAAYTSAKLRGTLHPLYAYLLHGDDSLDAIHFDLAVNYAGPSEMLDYFIARHVKADHKALWIHFDLNHVFDRVKSSRLSHGEYDRVFCVSADALQVYRKRYPEFASKAELFPNIIDRSEVLRQGDAPGVFTPVPDAINIVTVGRLEHIKGQDIALKALALLPPHFHWHFVGGEVSGERERLEKLACKLDVDRRAHFHGLQPNPYPFMAGADIYVQPSRSEGSPLTLGEARLFGAPVVTTPFASAPRLLADLEGRSIIADAMTPPALAKAIARASSMGKTPRTEAAAPGKHSPINAISEIFEKQRSK